MGTVFDAVDFTNWSIQAGQSLAWAVSSACTEEDDNDAEGLWCSDTRTFGLGDQGSPGVENMVECLSSVFSGIDVTSNNYGSSPGFSVAQAVTIDADGYVSGFGAYSLYAGFNDIKMALYADAGGLPGELIATSLPTLAANGLTFLETDNSQTCAFAVEPGTYWVAFIGNYTSATYAHFISYNTSMSVTNAYRVQSYDEDWADPYSPSGTYATSGYSVGVFTNQ